MHLSYIVRGGREAVVGWGKVGWGGWQGMVEGRRGDRQGHRGRLA